MKVLTRVLMIPFVLGFGIVALCLFALLCAFEWLERLSKRVHWPALFRKVDTQLEDAHAWWGHWLFCRALRFPDPYCKICKPRPKNTPEAEQKAADRAHLPYDAMGDYSEKKGQE